MCKGGAPTAGTFNDLLRWLDAGVDSGGGTYLDMRARLVAYFDRKRCPFPDDLADETLNRVAKRLQEVGTIEDVPPARYCYIVARYVFLESLRSPERLVVQHTAEARAGVRPAAEPGAGEELLECLDRCLDALGAADRTLILEYYSAESGSKIARRRALAASLGLTSNALAIRASRIRARLEACVTECAKVT